MCSVQSRGNWISRKAEARMNLGSGEVTVSARKLFLLPARYEVKIETVNKGLLFRAKGNLGKVESEMGRRGRDGPERTLLHEVAGHLENPITKGQASCLFALLEKGAMDMDALCRATGISGRRLTAATADLLALGLIELDCEGSNGHSRWSYCLNDSGRERARALTGRFGRLHEAIRQDP